MPNRNGGELVERRASDRDFAEWRAHVDRRLDKQDETLQDIRNMLGASRLGLAAIKWLVTIGAGLAAMITVMGKLK